MKIWLIFFAILQSFWSVEAGLFAFRYIVGLNLSWSFLVCLGLGILDFNLYYYLIEKLHRWLLRRPYFRNWRSDRFSWQCYQDSSWVRRCHRWGRRGLFLSGFVPHLLFFGIAAQKIFQFKNGYWPLFFGNVLKIAALAYGFKIFEHFAGF